MKYIGFGLAGLGLLLALFGVSFLYDGLSLGGWPAVTGTVKEVTLRTDVTRTTKSSPLVRRFYPSISYRYTVEGIEYESERYQLGTTHEKFEERNDARTAAQKFVVGADIPVYYDPSNPSSAVLDNSFSWSCTVPLILGLVFLLTGWGITKIPAGTTPDSAFDVA
ncbi:MAG: DUF3592 domain-containing protein [Bdellovibrionales bacterium]|nr:DUF3592 domain-containing protein [Bdellovibrionales bacterium]